MKKGFTLIEMIGSIVILAIIALVAFPAVLNILNSSQGKIDDNMKSYAIGAAKEYVNDHVNCYPRSSSSYTYPGECTEKPSLQNNNTKKQLTVNFLISEGYMTDKSVTEEMKDDYVLVGVNGYKVYTFEYKVQ